MSGYKKNSTNSNFDLGTRGADTANFVTTASQATIVLVVIVGSYLAIKGDISIGEQHALY